jgi:hypothetical protein
MRKRSIHVVVSKFVSYSYAIFSRENLAVAENICNGFITRYVVSTTFNININHHCVEHNRIFLQPTLFGYLLGLPDNE